MTPFVPGDSVKLTNRFAAVLSSTPRAKHDWKKRRGVIRKCNSKIAYVVWDGTRSMDPLPVSVVELADAA
jgi:hypothetical protein